LLGSLWRISGGALQPCFVNEAASICAPRVFFVSFVVTLTIKDMKGGGVCHIWFYGTRDSRKVLVKKMCGYISKFYISLAAVLCLAISSVRSLHADELSAEDIMAKSNVAMSQPLRYTRFSDNGVEMVVYKKTLPDGSIASLTNFPATKKILIVYGEKRYEISLEHQVAIDMSGIVPGEKDQTASWASDLVEDKTPQKIYEYIGIVRYNDKECYEILEKISPEFREAVLEKMPENIRERVRDGLRAKSRFLMDKETYLTLVSEKLTEEGITIAKVEYKDIQSQPDLSDDFFQLPHGLEVLSPQSSKEYLAIVADRLSPRHLPVDANVKAEQERIKAEIERVKAEQERVKGEKARIDAEHEKKKQEILSKYKDSVWSHEEYPLPEPSNRWTVFVIVNGMGIALILILWLLHRWRK
jgi:hypothetical protein